MAFFKISAALRCLCVLASLRETSGMPWNIGAKPVSRNAKFANIATKRGEIARESRLEQNRLARNSDFCTQKSTCVASDKNREAPFYDQAALAIWRSTVDRAPSILLPHAPLFRMN